jgi:hypothetical protein
VRADALAQAESSAPPEEGLVLIAKTTSHHLIRNDERLASERVIGRAEAFFLIPNAPFIGEARAKNGFAPAQCPQCLLPS